MTVERETLERSGSVSPKTAASLWQPVGARPPILGCAEGRSNTTVGTDLGKVSDADGQGNVRSRFSGTEAGRTVVTNLPTFGRTSSGATDDVRGTRGDYADDWLTSAPGRDPLEHYGPWPSCSGAEPQHGQPHLEPGLGLQPSPHGQQTFQVVVGPLQVGHREGQGPSVGLIPAIHRISKGVRSPVRGREVHRIQALDRTRPLLPMRPGQVERRTA